MVPFMIRRLLLCVALSSVTVSCRTTSAETAVKDAPAAAATLYFHDSFEESRAAFLAAADLRKADGTDVTVTTRELATWANDPSLHTDFAFFKGAEGVAPRRLLVISAGIHGIEGYTASAVETLFVKEQIGDVLAKGVDVLVIHGLNAYGFKHKSRYTEARVDLNRTWFADDAFPGAGLDDGGYTPFNKLFNPEGVPTFGRLDFKAWVLTKLTPNLGAVTSGKLTKAAGTGQFKFPKGIIYGGSDFQPHRAMVLTELKKYFGNYDRVMGWDLHTGLGKKQMQMLPNPPYSPGMGERRKKVFEVEGRKIEETGGVDFYSSWGDFSDFVCQIYEKAKPDGACVSMLLEYGTLKPADWDSPAFSLGIKNSIDQAYTLYVNIRENQMVNYGAKPDDLKAMREAYEGLFLPKDASWRTMVVTEARSLLPAIVEKFLEL